MPAKNFISRKNQVAILAFMRVLNFKVFFHLLSRFEVKPASTLLAFNSFVFVFFCVDEQTFFIADNLFAKLARKGWRGLQFGSFLC